MKKGFTLIELLIVIAIVGILVATVAPKYANFAEDANKGATQSGLSSLRGALRMYAGKHQESFPNNLDGLTPTYIQRIPTNKLTDTTDSATSCDSATGWAYNSSEGSINACCTDDTKDYCNSSYYANW